MKVRRKFQYDPSCVLYLPLYELDGASFASRDAYGHLCTVTGATWGLQGRTFNGTSDWINCGTSSILVPPQITLEFWLYITESGAMTYAIAERRGYGGESNGYFVFHSNKRFAFETNGNLAGDLLSTTADFALN